MSETQKETQVEETQVEEVDLDFNIEDLPEDASQEDKDKAIKTLTAQKAHWRKKHDDLVTANEKPEEKAEEKKETKEEVAEATTELSQSDIITLSRSELPEEDIAEVIEYARYKKVSIKEALTSPVVEGILATNKEARTVADATNTGKSNQTKSGTSDDELMANAKKGIMPESDADMERLAKLRLGT